MLTRPPPKKEDRVGHDVIVPHHRIQGSKKQRVQFRSRYVRCHPPRPECDRQGCAIPSHAPLPTKSIELSLGNILSADAKVCAPLQVTSPGAGDTPEAQVIPKIPTGGLI